MRTPIHNVSWDDAQTFIAWLSRRAGHAYRLPTEAEWEYAARAGTTSRYWWGEQLGTALGQLRRIAAARRIRERRCRWIRFQPNPFGLYGMLGGVAQWVQDCWFPNYSNAPVDGSARQSPSCMKRVLRGGSFRAGHRRYRCRRARGNYDAPVRYLANGFRVARDLD